MNQTTELTLTNGQRIKLEVVEGQPHNTFKLWLTDKEETQLLSSISLLAQLTPIQEVPQPKDFLKENLDDSIYDLYQAVIQHPTLATVQCSLVAELNNTKNSERMDTLKQGSLTDCLTEAFKQLKTYDMLYVWLPIGETIYNFVCFDTTSPDRQTKQISYLPKRVIHEAILTFDELNEHEIRLIETDQFMDEEILNSIARLSEETYCERLCNLGDYSVFEDIASDINLHGNAKKAINYLLSEDIDSTTPHNKARLKGLIHFAIQENQKN